MVHPLQLLLKLDLVLYYLSANNTYTGQTNINAGIISITDNNSLGSADGATIVADGASLSISNDITSAENITISGTGISSNGAIRNTADDNTLTGLITLGANSEIQIDTGSSLTLNPTTGSAVTGTYNLTIESVGTSTISDPIAISTGNIIKTGAGTLTLSGTNTFTGDLTISAGTVTVSGTLHDDVDVINSGTYDVDSTDTINSLRGSGAVELNTGITLTTGMQVSDTISGVISGAGNLTKQGAGTLTLSNTNTFTGDLTISAGTVTVSGTLHDDVDVINSGTYDVDSTDTINSLRGSGAVELNTGITLTTGDSGPDTISGVISGAGNLTKQGAGTLTLSGTNTFTGDTTISAGTIKLTGSVNALTDLSIASGATLDLQSTQTFATLDLDGTISNSAGSSELTITGASDIGGSITTSGTQDYEGAITLTDNTTLVSGDQITFDTTVNSEGSETNNLTVTATELQVDGIIGGTQTLGAISITGILDLNAAITNATSLSVSSTSNLGADVTTSSTQTYTSGVTLSGGNRTLTASIVNFVDTLAGGTNGLTITGNLDLDGAATGLTTLAVSGTSNLGADVTTSGTQTYTGAVTLSADVVLTTTHNNATFGSTIDSDSSDSKSDLTLTLGSGSASVTGIVGTTALDVLTLNSSSSFTAAVTASSIVNAASTTATFSDNVTATITNSGTLLFNATDAKSVTGTIAEAAGGDTTEVQVINSANGEAPSVVTFTATVAADTLTVGTTSKAGAALFEDDVTVPAINITGGDHADEDSTVTFNTAVTSSSGITLDDNTGDAKVIFAQNNPVNITSTIDGGADNEGTIQVTGATKTFTSTIGGTYDVGTLNIDNTSIYTGAVTVDSLDIAANKTATFKNNVTLNTSATINSSATFLVASADSAAAITVTGSVLGASDGVGTVQITNTGGTTFSDNSGQY